MKNRDGNHVGRKAEEPSSRHDGSPNGPRVLKAIPRLEGDVEARAIKKNRVEDGGENLDPTAVVGPEHGESGESTEDGAGSGTETAAPGGATDG